MSTLDKARSTQIRNIEAKTGKTLDELTHIIQATGLTRHAEIRDHLMGDYHLGYGDASMLVHYALKTDGQSAAEAIGASPREWTDQIYHGKTELQRQMHDRIMQALEGFGPFEIAPKKSYLSLRRKRQFAMLGPASKGRIEVGLNMKGLAGTDRLILQPPGGMCQYKVFVDGSEQVDDELLAWFRTAYESAA